MSQLTIHDLSFCESALADSNQVQGGAVASFSTSFQAANSTRNSAFWSIIGSPTSPNADIVGYFWWYCWRNRWCNIWCYF
jgi:hypothetical protein